MQEREHGTSGTEAAVAQERAVTVRRAAMEIMVDSEGLEALADSAVTTVVGQQGSQNTSSWSEEDVRMQAAENYIRNRAYAEALHVTFSETDRHTARWYYLSAMANSGQGNNITAKEHAQKAAEMEPNNIAYRRLIGQTSKTAGSGIRQWVNPTGIRLRAAEDWCVKLCALNLFCNCCCGGRTFYC